jgi:GH25 family lysozyme M1 (1,4-beta-N-acetylmuramidase)
MKGVDISHYQKGLTIKQIKDAGNEFAVIKVTEGNWLRDGAAVDFYREAYETGFPVGCYCYSHATTVEEAAKEAQFLLDTVNRFPMPCGIFLDIEEPKQLDLAAEKLRAVVEAWCGAITEADYVTGVYGSEGNLWAKLDPDTLPEGCLVWVAKWSQSPPNMSCDLWQSGDNGSIRGVTVDTDEARSERFKKLVERGFDMPKDEPSSEPEPEDKPDISGALGLLAEYIRTPEFAQNFLKYIEGRKKHECT